MTTAHPPVPIPPAASSSSSSSSPPQVPKEPSEDWIDPEGLLSELLSLSRGKQIRHLPDVILRQLFEQVEAIFRSEPPLLRLSSAVRIIAQTKADFFLLRDQLLAGGLPPNTTWLIAGNFTSRGRYHVETIALIYCLKLLYPESVYIIRGKNEIRAMSRIYGMYDEFKRRYNIKMWKYATEAFNFMPYACLIDSEVLVLPGGITPSLKEVEAIEAYEKVEPEDGTEPCDLMFSHYDNDALGWIESHHGTGFGFGMDILDKFLKRNKLRRLITTTAVLEEGYSWYGSNRQVLTFSSARDYLGEFDNHGAVLHVRGVDDIKIRQWRSQNAAEATGGAGNESDSLQSDDEV